MTEVGHGAKRSRGATDYVRIGIESLIALLLALLVVMANSMNQSQARVDRAVIEVQRAVIELQITTTRTESKVDGLSDRMDRLERIQDQDQ